MRAALRAPRILGRIAGPLGWQDLKRNLALIRTVHRIHRVALKELRSPSPQSLGLARAYVRLTGDLFAFRPRTLGALATGRANWLEAESGRAFEGALELAQVLCRQRQHRLAIELAGLVVDIRPASRASWRLLATAYHEVGDDARAARARRRGRIGTEPATHQGAVRAVLDRVREGVTTPAADPAAALAAAVDEALRERLAVDETFVAAACALQPPTTKRAADAVAAVVLRSAVTAGGPPAPWVDELGHAWAASRGGSDLRLLPAETALDVRTVDVSGLRRYLDGRSVCLVANSRRVAESGAGDRIDAYDVVVRFNSFAIDAPNTGRRTDVHATIHLHDYNWSVPVDLRIVLGGKPSAWRQSIVKHLVAGAQEYLGDASLRWPVRDPALLADDVVDLPTSGFNMLRLVDFLDVSPVLDLVGFDFNTTGAYRLPQAMSLPVAAAHDYAAERAWVMARATRADDLVISLR